MEYKVDEVSLQDKEDWESLYRQYADFYNMPMEQDTLDRVWAWIHSETEEFYCTVARDHDENPIGFMHFRAMPSPLRGAKVGFLDDLFIAPQFRGTGVVEALFNYLKLRAQAHNWPFVRWITAWDNARAQAVYDKCSERTQWVTYQLSIENQPE